MPLLWGRIAFMAMALACAWHTRVLAQLLPTGDEFRVNSYTPSSQIFPRITGTTPGNFVISWESYDQYGEYYGGWDIFVRRFAEPQTPIGTEMRVNTYTTGDQRHSHIAARPTGEFVVTWESYYQDGSYRGSFWQRFDSAGTPQGGEFQVTNTTIGDQDHPEIKTTPTGFVIVWEDYPDPVNNGDTNLLGRIYDSSMVPQGTEFQLNEPSTRLGVVSDILVTADGFLATWGDGDFDGDAGSVVARRFDSSGAIVSTEFLVNTYTTGPQGSSRAAALGPDGSFIIIWSGEGLPDNSFRAVFGQRFDSTGSKLGTEFQINAYTTGAQLNPSISSNSAGEFVVVWQSNNQDGNGYGIFARSFKPDGTPETPEIQVNQFTSGHQFTAEIAAVDERTVVIVWTSQLQDGAFNGLYARRFRRAGDRLTGKKLSLKTSSSSPANNSLTFVSKDPSLEMPESVFEDPRCPPSGSGNVSAGAKLRVSGAGGDFTIDLPCVNWSANASGTRYRYRDGSGATCNAIVLRAGRLMKAICRGAQINYNLGAAQGDVRVALSTGDPSTNRKYCASFGPESSATVIRDGSDGRNYRAVQANAGVCP